MDEIRHFYHDHPLILTETRVGDTCEICLRSFSGEPAFGCNIKCRFEILVHEECAEFPTETRHPRHPQHKLKQTKFYWWDFRRCAVCGLRLVSEFGYECFWCNFYIHLLCTRSIAVTYTEKQTLQHPSHPTHQLKLLNRSSSFRCDGCGTIENGKSYVCSDCQFWIHQSCASLPSTMERENHHHHPLSLAFHLPEYYHKFGFKCDICHKKLLLNYWVYHCDLCRYAVHIKCALETSNTTQSDASSNSISNAAYQDAICLPVNDFYEELIKPFIMRLQGRRGAVAIPEINAKCQFHNHQHELSLVKEDDCEEEDADDDPDRELMIHYVTAHPQHYLHQFWYVRDHKCEACGNECDSFAYYCRSCGFTLHYQCALLPLSDKHRWDKHPLPLTYDANINHPTEFYCEICEEEMNPKSWMYHCRQCDQSFHPKCLPTTGPNRHIKFGQQHVISSCHRRDHPLTHVQVSIKLRCDFCHRDVYGDCGLECASCNFVMCLSCAQEPKDAIGTTEKNGDS
ncbi:hypothetical protein Pfo_020321 [Paulownia fortunei]|nr:hypothetical protein Pfo_020321 [Paulownia fortunei]